MKVTYYDIIIECPECGNTGNKYYNDQKLVDKRSVNTPNETWTYERFMLVMCQDKRCNHVWRLDLND